MLAVFRKEGLACFRVRVRPHSSRLEVAGLHGDALKIFLTAGPFDNNANIQLLEVISRILGVPKRTVHILSGKRSKEKTLGVEGLGEEDLLRLLEPCLR